MVALHYSTLHRFEIFSVPGTIAHGSIRLPPNRWCRQYNRVMLNGYGSENGIKKKKSKRSNYQEKNNNFARAAHFLFHISLPLLLQCETSELNILWRKCRMRSQKTFAACVPVRLFFFTAAHFHLAGRWHFSFSHRRYIISLFFFQRYSSPLFFSLVVALCRSFSRWASLACRLLSRFLCHSLSLHSKFVIMTINIKVMLHETIRNDDF